jgi:hypothetical protein
MMWHINRHTEAVEALRRAKALEQVCNGSTPLLDAVRRQVMIQQRQKLL